jgi:hypothetical protein
MQISKGQVSRPQRVVNYGPEGVGKSTFASHFPNPVFIDVEQGTSHLDVARTPTPNSFQILKQYVAELRADAQGFQTLVIDTADWAERLCIQDVCASNNLSAIGGQDDFGHSYNLLETAWAKFLDSLTDLSQTQNMNVVLLAHAQMRKFELPEEAGAFDRWELKLQKKTSALLKEWPDMLLFATYKTMVVEIKKTKKAQGGQRVLRTTHHPCWDAKNRAGLADELPYEFKAIAHAFPQFAPQQPTAAPAAPQQQAPQAPAQPPAAESQAPAQPAPEQPITQPGLPTDLAQLMAANNVTEAEIRKVVATKGYYPEETPITNYAPEFIAGVLVAAWDKVHAAITSARG